MAVYCVAFDLQQNGRDYSGLHEVLDQYDSIRLLDGAHLVDSPTDADTLRHHLSAHVAPGDRIWVSRVDEDHSGFVIAEAAAWLEQRRPL